MRADSPLARVVQRVAGSPAFAAVAPKVIPPLDRTLSRLSGGRVMLSRGMLPTLVLTTTGAQSGLKREAPLATLPIEDGAFLVVGSNFGRERHPAWTNNLLKHPDATVTYRGRTFAVRAHLLDGEERRAVWPRLIAMWPTYDRYVERSGRELRVFRLEPFGGAGGRP